MGEFLEECKHFLCNLGLGGTSKVRFLHDKLVETLSLVQILSMKELFQCVAIVELVFAVDVAEHIVFFRQSTWAW